jgi:hypothetical protein
MANKADMYPLVPEDRLPDSARDFVGSPAIQEHFANKSAVHESRIVEPSVAFARQLGAPVTQAAQGEISAEQIIAPPSTEPKI